MNEVVAEVKIMRYLNTKTLNELAEIISNVEALVERAEGGELSSSIEEVLAVTARQLNWQLYLSQEINLECINSDWQGDKGGCAEIKGMLPVWKLSMERRSGKKIDSEFWAIYEYFCYVDRDIIVENTIALFNSYPEEYKPQFAMLPQIYPFLTGTIDVEREDYSLIVAYVDMMKREIENFRWLYERLADYKSKQILLRIVRFWFTFDTNDLNDLHENIYRDYFDLDLLDCDEKEVFVDCGAYIGDTVMDYLEIYGGKYRRIYCYEISPEIIEQAKQNLAGYDDVIFRRKGAGAASGSMFIDENSYKAGTRMASDGKVAVDVVALDEDIKEPVTVIKMDIEGAEQDALKGAKRHITEDKPRLLISTYHKPEDLFQIPRLIDSMREDYTYYLRFNGRGLWPCDHVLFAV